VALDPFVWLVALRFLLKSKTQTTLIVLGIALGVSVQFFLLALLGGLADSLIDKTVGSAPHIYVSPMDTQAKPVLQDPKRIRDHRAPLYRENQEIFSWSPYVNKLRANPLIMAITPVVNGGGFIQKGGANYSVLVKGIDPQNGFPIYRIKEKMIAGKPSISGSTVLIGKSIATKLGLQVGDSFYLLTSKGSGDFLIVSGIFDLGAEIANDLILMRLERAQALFGLSGVTGIEARVSIPFQAQSIAADAQRFFTRVKIESWQDRNRELLTALKSQSGSSSLIQFMVMVSITLGIASVLGIVALQKSKQLGILKAMGATNAQTAGIFVVQGFLLGLIGGVLGILLGFWMGVGFTQATAKSGVSYGLAITPYNILFPFILATVCSTLAAGFPARKAAKLSPVEVIRNG